MLPTPPDWSNDEVAIVHTLWHSGSHSIEIAYEATPHRLVGDGWLCAWPGLQRFTFTPLGAHALGLTLDGEPARWCDRAEQKRLRSKRGGSGVVARETDSGVSLDEIAGPVAMPTIVLMGCGGWHGLIGLPIHIAQRHHTWGSCEVCGGTKLPVGTDCGRCDQKPVHGVAFKRGMAG